MVLDSEKPENMETLRGFSFMPELPDMKGEMKLEYIEGEELERTWKMTRRQRLKEREQRIWDDFVKEQDILATVCQDDPYQFLETLPEQCLKELMEVELVKLKKEIVVEQPQPDVQEEKSEQIGDGDSPRKHNEAPLPTVTFADEVDGYESDVIHIFDNEKDDDPSGPDDDALNDTPSSPCTVREKFDEEKESGPSASSPTRPLSPNKSTENVTNMIESSIYCAKVKELRMKINEEILAVIASLEDRDIAGTDPEELVKMCRRSSEFCARFNRIYMYQLHRQIHDVKRHNSASLPFARHTQFQSQMVRIVSLHNSLLQALQIFHKSFSTTRCARAACGALRGLAALARDASAAAAAAPAPPHLASARGLYLDSVLISCDKLEKTINEYAEKITSYMNTVLSPRTSTRSKQSRTSKGKRSMATWSKTGSNIKSVAESRLSMYSLDKQKVNMHPKSCSSKDNQSSGTGTSKVRGGLGSARKDMATSTKQTTPHKSPRFRRPLMRDPHKGRTRRPVPQDSEIRTMVENVEACTPSHMTPEPSPRGRADARRRTPHAAPRIKARATNTPRGPHAPHAPGDRPDRPASPYVQGRRLSPKPPPPTHASADSSPPQLSPVSAVHCSARGTPRSAYESPRSVHPDPPRPSPRIAEDIHKKEKERMALEREKNKIPNVIGPGGRCEVSRIVRQLCGGDAAGNRHQRVSGAKNAQLLCVDGSSPRQPSTPQLLRILEETIQKKVPKGLYQKTPSTKGAERFRMTFSGIPEGAADNLFQYRTKFVQHMLASPMYANCAVGKPWEMIGNISDQIIDQLLVKCAEEMQLQDTVLQLYHAEAS